MVSGKIVAPQFKLENEKIVRRLIREGAPRDVLEESLHRLELCDCGSEDGDASCYGCLGNYRNQFYHEDLKRGMVVEFLRRVLS